MKLFDYIFYPDPKALGEWTVEGMDFEHECVGHMIGPVICLTLEELRELWNAAQDRACAMQMGEPGDTKIFESFLESKGVIIP